MNDPKNPQPTNPDNLSPAPDDTELGTEVTEDGTPVVVTEDAPDDVNAEPAGDAD